VTRSATRRSVALTLLTATVLLAKVRFATSSERFVGADLSYVPRLRSIGAVYTIGGEPKDALEIFADHGYRVVRLRLWHTPKEPWHALDATVLFAQEIVSSGLDVMLDVHYSDTWADPGHQTKPEAWQDIPFVSLVDSVYAYTNAVVRRFRDAGALPAHVQIGNEISPGFLWDEGRVGWQGSEWDTPKQWEQFGDLLAAAVRGVRDSLAPAERPEIILHVDNGAGNRMCRWFYDGVIAQGVEFDVIGVSFYPWWHGNLDALAANLTDLAAAYGKEIHVVETSYPWTLEDLDGTGNFVEHKGQLHRGYPATPAGQADFLEAVLSVVESVPGGLGTAVVYWEPAFISVPGGPPNPHENLTLFDFGGSALPGLSFGLDREAPGSDDPPLKEQGDAHGR
jgi:arabinogalactan endo-1,4-beta-galactosidase